MGGFGVGGVGVGGVWLGRVVMNPKLPHRKVAWGALQHRLHMTYSIKRFFLYIIICLFPDFYMTFDKNKTSCAFIFIFANNFI